MKKKMLIERGSVLILTMMAVLILSVLVSGLLEVGTTEIYTTQNYELQKAAYYKAIEGVEEIRSLIIDPNNDALDIAQIRRYPAFLEGPLLVDDISSDGTIDHLGGLERSYITGTLIDMESYYYDANGAELSSPNTSAAGNIRELLGFDVPPIVGTSVQNMVTIGFDVTVTARVKAAERVAYSEINCGVYYATHID